LEKETHAGNFLCPNAKRFPREICVIVPSVITGDHQSPIRQEAIAVRELPDFAVTGLQRREIAEQPGCLQRRAGGQRRRLLELGIGNQIPVTFN
jgi:pyocin large subunit-like protein